MLAPVHLVIKPPPEEVDQLLWNGQALKADMTRPGTYRIEAQGVAISSYPQKETVPLVP